MGREGGEVDFFFWASAWRAGMVECLLLVFLACTRGWSCFYEFTGGFFLCDYDDYDALDGTSGAIYGPQKGYWGKLGDGVKGIHTHDRAFILRTYIWAGRDKDETRKLLSHYTIYLILLEITRRSTIKFC